MRVDKWLWFARALKTRTLAAATVAEGRVRVNGARIDAPSRPVKPGDVLTVTLPERVLVWKVTAEGARRGPASEARLLYEDLSPSPALSPDAAPSRDPGVGRPTKQERRAIDRLLRRT
jgi:ribosome-associated heat shock protein Hsp15